MEINVLKDLLKIAKAINNFELNQKLMELQQELMQLQDENRTLKDRVRELQDKCNKSEEARWADDAYWVQKAEGLDGPFCTGCFDTNKQLVRLTQMGEVFHDIATHRCPSCHQHCSPKKPE